MDDKEIIEAAKHCTTGDCETCKLCDCDCECSLLFAKFIAENFEEKEPAPSANDTSSENKTLQLNDSTKNRICQAFKEADRACQNILESYSNMSDEEQKAFDLGEIYRDMLTVKDELEELKAGEHND